MNSAINRSRMAAVFFADFLKVAPVVFLAYGSVPLLAAHGLEAARPVMLGAGLPVLRAPLNQLFRLLARLPFRQAAALLQPGDQDLG